MSIATCNALSSVYQISLRTITKAMGLKSMINARYAHCSCLVRETIIVFGGFAHQDVPEEPPQTLTQCESMSRWENYWEPISPMNTARAFMSCAAIKDQYVYLFGGMSDYKILNSIEKYDVITDTWISLYFKLPTPLAKHVSVSLENGRHILIMGGMSADFEPLADMYQLDLTVAKFVKKRQMKYARLNEGGQGAFLSQQWNIFFLNGYLDEYESEMYRPSKN